VARSVDDVCDRLGNADGLVNASPVGMADGRSPLPPALLRPEMWVFDIIYRPLETELLRQARGAGCAVVNGGGMVVAQAAEAFRLITGIGPDVERMYGHFVSMTAAGAVR
jgi:shikimate dehydrogenase